MRREPVVNRGYSARVVVAGNGLLDQFVALRVEDLQPRTSSRNDVDAVDLSVRTKRLQRPKGKPLWSLPKFSIGSPVASNAITRRGVPHAGFRSSLHEDRLQ